MYIADNAVVVTCCGVLMAPDRDFGTMPKEFVINGINVKMTRDNKEKVLRIIVEFGWWVYNESVERILTVLC